MTPPRALRLAALPAAVLSLCLAVPGSAQQQPAPNGGRPRVYFDCQGPNCNLDYYRTEIGWVNWVRDGADAQVHVIVVSTGTGAGGRAYEMEFQGRNGFATYRDRIVYTSAPTDTDRETLDGITHTLGLGLARFANTAGYRDIVRLEGPPAGTGPTAGLVSAEEVEDPWNLWAFRIGGNGNVDQESTRETERLTGDVSASRVTPTWKINNSGRVNFQRDDIERSDSTRLLVRRTDWNLDQLVVYSVADHWSFGVHSNAARLTRFNQDLRGSILPALEFSVFPYEQATRRSLTFYYEVGPTYRNYIEETIFEKMEETRFEQSLQVRYSQRETWGDASLALEGSHFLDNFDQRNIALRGNLSLRITRGLSLEVNSNASWVGDQIYLSAEDVSDEEIFLRLLQRSTDFTFGASIGFSFQFGSIYNNVVNNRFRRGFEGRGGGGGGGGGGG